jgi:surface protein
MPTVTSSEDKVVLLFAVFPNGNNLIAFKFTTSAGQYQVDWGDGTTTLHNSLNNANKQYSYSAISAATECSRGYRQVIITITPVSGVFTTMDLQERHTLVSSVLTPYSVNILDVIISMPNATTGQSIEFGGAVQLPTLCERVDIKASGSITSAKNLFAACSRLQEYSFVANTQNITDFSGMFGGCRHLEEVSLFDTLSGTTIGGMFGNCHNLKSVPLFNTQNVTNMASLFDGCYSLNTIPAFNTQQVTDMSNMLGGVQMKTLPLLDMQNVTTTFRMLVGCNRLSELPSINTPNLINMGNMFFYCTDLETVPLFNTQNVTNMSGSFSRIQALKTLPLFNTQNVTTMANMFLGSGNIREVPLFNTVKVTSMNNMFNICGKLKSIPAFNTPLITTTSGTDFGVGFAQNALSLTVCNLSFSRTVGLTNARLSRAEIVKIFNNLADRAATTSATITLTGSWGVSRLSSADRAIATNKNWTIVG